MYAQRKMISVESAVSLAFYRVSDVCFRKDSETSSFLFSILQSISEVFFRQS